MIFKIIKKLKDKKRTYIICKKLNNQYFLMIHENDSSICLLVNGTKRYLYQYLKERIEGDIEIIPMTLIEKQKYYEMN